MFGGRAELDRSERNLSIPSGLKPSPLAATAQIRGGKTSSPVIARTREHQEERKETDWCESACRLAGLSLRIRNDLPRRFWLQGDHVGSFD
jgi:hypothetical protein